MGYSGSSSSNGDDKDNGGNSNGGGTDNNQQSTINNQQKVAVARAMETVMVTATTTTQWQQWWQWRRQWRWAAVAVGSNGNEKAGLPPSFWPICVGVLLHVWTIWQLLVQNRAIFWRLHICTGPKNRWKIGLLFMLPMKKMKTQINVWSFYMRIHV
jgi:hypothetical protein